MQDCAAAAWLHWLRWLHYSIGRLCRSGQVCCYLTWLQGALMYMLGHASVAACLPCVDQTQAGGLSCPGAKLPCRLIAIAHRCCSLLCALRYRVRQQTLRLCTYSGAVWQGLTLAWLDARGRFRPACWRETARNGLNCKALGRGRSVAGNRRPVVKPARGVRTSGR